MWIVLLTLKIIGFILLILLCLILVSAAAVLFSPIRYYIESEYNGSIYVCFKAFIWFKMLGLSYNCTDNGSEAKIILFWKGFDINDFSGTKKKHRASSGEKRKKNKRKNINIALKKPKTTKKESIKSNKKTPLKNKKNDTGKKNSKKNIKAKKTNDNKFIFGDTLAIISEIWNAFKETENKKEIAGYSLGLLKGLFKALKNRIFNVKIKFGFDEPDRTGITLGIGCAVNAMLPVDIELEPDFENQCLWYKGEIKGRTSFFALLLPIVIYIFKKPVWNLLFSGKEEN